MSSCKLLLLIASLTLLFSCKDQSTTAVAAKNTGGSEQTMQEQKVTVEEAIALADKGYVFVDCRTPEEIADGKIEGAIEMDVKSGDYREKVIESWPRDKKIILYCQSGIRSGRTAKLLSDMNFTHVVDMTGGYGAWADYQNKNK